MFDSINELADAVADYSHRPNLRQRSIDYFIPLAGLRIGRDLESRWNESQVTLTGADPMPTPADFGKIRSLIYQGAEGTTALRARDNLTFNGMPRQGTPPSWYNIRNGGIYTRPIQTGEFELNYYSAPVLDEVATTNEVLTYFPQLYLYGALIELHVWAQDSEQRELAMGFYTSEVREINKQERRARMSAPQAIGA